MLIIIIINNVIIRKAHGMFNHSDKKKSVYNNTIWRKWQKNDEKPMRYTLENPEAKLSATTTNDAFFSHKLCVTALFDNGQRCERVVHQINVRTIGHIFSRHCGSFPLLLSLRIFAVNVRGSVICMCAWHFVIKLRNMSRLFSPETHNLIQWSTRLRRNKRKIAHTTTSGEKMLADMNFFFHYY